MADHMQPGSLFGKDFFFFPHKQRLFRHLLTSEVVMNSQNFSMLASYYLP